MQAGRGVTAMAALALLALSACGGGDDQPRLMQLRSSTNGPDEFAIVPPKPLEMPEDMAALPEPTPGGENRTDQRPLDDAVVALGGNPDARRGVPAGDAALYNHASRFGVQQDIRGQLAAEDLQWRRDNKGRILERLFNVNVYYNAYDKQSLDQSRELSKWRRKGLRTPSAPPVESLKK